MLEWEHLACRYRAPIDTVIRRDSSAYSGSLTLDHDHDHDHDHDED